MKNQATDIHVLARNMGVVAAIQTQQYPAEVHVRQVGIHRQPPDTVFAVINIYNNGRRDIDVKSIHIAAKFGFDPPAKDDYTFNSYFDTEITDGIGRFPLSLKKLPVGRVD